jgi:hypothetical protein
MRAIKFVQKLGVVGLAALALSSLNISNLYAASASETYLYNIMVYTNQILAKVNNLPAALEGLSRYALSWLSIDDSQSTKTMQAEFGSLTQAYLQNTQAQNSQQLRITADLLGVPVTRLAAAPDSANSILSILPNVNDLAYSTLLNLPPVNKAPNLANSPYNYIKHASGMSIKHTLPGQNWQGSDQAQSNYTNYYNTTIAVTSFNAYILSKLAAQASDQNSFTKTQNQLIQAASNSSWFAQIASEELGKVLRQMLMFESQNFVLMSQILQTEKDLLAAQVMNNSLAITANNNYETLLVLNAQGLKPSLVQ